MKNKVFTAILTLFFSYQSNSQSTMHFSVANTVYQGDLTPKHFGSFNVFNPRFEFGVSTSTSHSISFGLFSSLGLLEGRDDLYNLPNWRKERNFSFRARYFDIS